MARAGGTAEREEAAALPLGVVMLGLTALGCWIPAAHATVTGDPPTAQAFFYSGMALLVLFTMLAIVSRRVRAHDPPQRQLMALIVIHLMMPLAMALPLRIIVPDTTWLDAWFEMLSAFTTTGASVYATAPVPPSVDLWRGIVGWSGGAFAIVATLAILAPLNLAGTELLTGRVPGSALVRAARRERLRRHALTVIPVYVALTLLLWGLLRLAGEERLGSLITAMGVLSTSGVAPASGESALRTGALGEALILPFFLLALSGGVWLGGRRHPTRGRRLHDAELRLGLVLIGVAGAAILARHLIFAATIRGGETAVDVLRAVWGALFTAASFLTTTGYRSTGWDLIQPWASDSIVDLAPDASGMILLALAVAGGGVATAAGGLKLLRLVALYRHGRFQLEGIVHPSVVAGRASGGGGGLGARVAWAYLMLFAMSLVVILILLTIAGEEFQQALLLAFAALTTTGQLADILGVHEFDYAMLNGFAKCVLGAAMVMGRLEILAVIAALMPGRLRPALSSAAIMQQRRG